MKICVLRRKKRQELHGSTTEQKSSFEMFQPQDEEGSERLSPFGAVVKWNMHRHIIGRWQKKTGTNDEKDLQILYFPWRMLR